MGAGRPKLEIPRKRIINIRVTDFEFEKISKIADKKIFLKPKQFCRELICSLITSQKDINLLQKVKPKMNPALFA